MRRIRRSVLLRAIFTNSAAFGASPPKTPPSSSPSEPRMDVNGVRSSWLTVETNSFFILSSRRRSVMSRK